jgi:hypothetical protein
VGKLFGGYRPELHYMRGPGPKWLERYGERPAPVATTKSNLPLSIWIVPAATVALLGLAAIVALA